MSSRHWIAGVLLGLGLIVIGAVVVFIPRGQPAVPQTSVTIVTKDMAFSTSTITAKLGQPITIRLENQDIMNHSFAIDALNVYSDEIEPGKATTITFTPQQVGSFQFRCPINNHAQLGMVGTFQVVG